MKELSKVVSITKRKKLTEEKLQEKLDELVDNILKHGDPLEQFMRLKIMENSCKYMRSELSKSAIKEAEKREKETVIDGVNFYVNNTPKVYDFSGDKNWEEKSERVKEWNKRKKAREAYLKKKGKAKVKSNGSPYLAVVVSSEKNKKK